MKFPLFLKFFFAVVFFFALERFCHKQTAGFSLSKISSASISTSPPLEEGAFGLFFDQPYYFLDSGGQCYAFISADGYTVLKLFKNHHIRFWNWLNKFMLPEPFDALRRRFLRKNIHQSPAFYESCRIAFEEFKSRSGLIYLHLGQTNYLQRKLTLYDKIGIRYEIDLDRVDFALQRRVEMPRKKLRILIRENDFEAAKACIDSLLHLIVERCQSGIKDRDPNIRRNLGFIGTHAVEIDIGSFTKTESQKQRDVYRIELLQSTRKLERWLKRHNAELAEYLAEQREAF